MGAGLPWLQLEDDFINGPLPQLIAADLKVEVPTAVGLWAFVWSWAQKHSDRGHVPMEIAVQTIEGWAHWQKKPGAFYASALKRGLLREHQERGTVELVGLWERYGKALEKREKDRDRKEADRQLQKLLAWNEATPEDFDDWLHSYAHVAGPKTEEIVRKAKLGCLSQKSRAAAPSEKLQRGVQRTSERHPRDIRETSDGSPADIRATSERHPAEVLEMSTRENEKESLKPPPPPPISVDVNEALENLSEGEGEVVELVGTSLGDVPIDNLPDTPDGFWEWMGRIRLKKGLKREQRKPLTFENWHANARREFDVGAMCQAYFAFLGDDEFRRKGWPAGVFISEGVFQLRAQGASAPRRRNSLEGYA